VKHAQKQGVPVELAHRVIMRESRYNPAARNRSYFGLMQLRYATAKGMGYSGGPAGLLDAETNLRYGMAYLGNAYRVAGGDQNRAVRLYSGGYYYEAKRKGMLGDLRRGDEVASVQ
jgi:soluble lytic murein transglycosylase-like protein